jgi:ribosomal protein S18 acetylase RimI-like enzyme
MVSIRAYEPSDQAGLATCILELQNFERALEPDRVEGEQIVTRNLADLLTMVEQRCGQIFVAELKAAIVGFVSVRLEHETDLYTSTLMDYAYIADLVVLPFARGQGYGTALLRKAEDFARQHSMKTLKIQVLVNNQQAAAVYRRAGFRPYELTLLKQVE